MKSLATHVAMVFAALISTTILTACGQQGSTSQSSTQGPPFNLSYATNPANYTYGVAITPNILNVSKSVNTLSISPALPTGLSFDSTTGTISGTPTTMTPSAGYTVSGTNAYGSNFVVLQLAIVDFAPTLTYSGPNPVSAYTVGTAITPITPTLGGGATLSCNSSPQLPAGLTLSSACIISGTPTAPTAANNYTISAVNSGGSASFTVNLTVDAIAPAIAYPSSPYTFVHGQAAPATSVVNSGGPIVSCSISPTLPTGLTFNTTTCQIAGTPSVVAASQAYTVIAANTGGSSTTTVTITVSDIVPVIHYSPATYTLTQGTAITSPLAVVNTGGVINTCSESGLPAGLSIDASCNITGTPTTLSTATIYNITASNTSGSSISTPITFTVNDALPNIHYAGSPYTFFNVTPITSFTPTNTGGAIISCAISPALPAGMTFSTVTCAIAGTPSAASAAANYTVTATNSGGSSNQVINIQVKETAPAITYSSSTYSFNRGSPITPLNVTNTGGPIVSCATFPALPVGLSLNTTTCQISGNPTTTTAPSTYTITATNSAGSGSKTLTITVNDTVPALTYTGSPYVLTNNQPISTITPVNSGGTVISCSILPALPTGLSLSTTCGISGTPSLLSAATSYTVTATNSGGNSTASLSLAVIDSAPIISYAGSPYNFAENTAITTISPANSGGAIVSCSISTALPSGLSFSTTNCQISGTPTVTSATTSYTITATNTGGTNSTSISITVTQLPNISYVGSPFAYTLGTPIAPLSATNTGGTIASCFTFPNLPTGLSISSTTCQISGTPSAITSSASYLVTATNAGGQQSTSITIAVNDVVPALTYSGTPFTLTQNQTISTITPTNTGGTPTSCSVLPALPTGLTFNTTTCSISGTPTVLHTASAFTVTATNTGGSSTATVSIAVVATAPVIAYAGSPYSFNESAAITAQTPSNTGSAIVSCAISPALPTGLAFNTTTCVISGTPTVASAATSYTITATNTGGSNSTSVSIAVVAPPTITFTGSPFSYTIGTSIPAITATNTGGSITSCSSSPALPAGLAISNTTCQISGTPTAISAATTYTIAASNVAGSSAPTISIAIKDVIPALTYAGSPYSFLQNQTITTVTPINSGGAPTSCSVLPALPTGLSLNTTTCALSGTPTVLSASSAYTVSATNSGGTTTASITLAVIATAPVISFAGSPYTFNKSALITTQTPSNTGGTIVSCAITPALPTGLAFSTTTCAISGTPTVASAATSYTITATNTGGSNATSVSITVLAAPVITYTGSPFSYTINSAITALSAANTGGVITSCSASPALPAGLSLSSTTCQITGTPTAVSAATTYTITASNAAGSSAPTISIAIKDIVPALTYSGSPYIFTLSQPITTVIPTNTGGTPTSCSVAPALPTGLNLNTTNCAISGTPTVLSASSAYTVTATNSGGSSTASVTLAVTATAPVISYSGSPYTFNKSAAITAQTPANTGGAIVSCAITPALPTGLAFSATTCVISGTPTVASASTSYTITATNTGGSDATSISITVLAPPAITYTGSPFTYTVNSMIPAITATNTGGTIASCSASPALPAGLSLSSTTCQITGTPTAISTATTYTITASNAAGSSAPTISITVKDVVPALTYAGSPYTFILNQPISTVTPTNTGGTPTGCTVLPALPTGLTLTATTCAISGTPTVLHASSAFTVTATNTGGSSTASVTLSVIAAAPVISYSGSPYTFNKSAAITAQTPANTGGAIVSCAITPALPTGLAFSTTTCVISGTPTVASASTSYTITATNTGGSDATSISITVLAPPAITYTGSPFTYTVNSMIPAITAANTGGTIASCSASPALPAGLSLSSTTCQITGTPTAISTATTYTITATNAAGSSAPTISITVKDVVPALTYSGNPYSFTLNQPITTVTPTNTGGTPTGCTVLPALPTGLTLTATTCAISGTPTVLHASSAFTVTATNTGGSSTASVTIAVIAAAPVISYAGSPYVFNKSAAITAQTPSNTGGAIVSCAITPALPTGLAFSTTTCVISGTPTVVSAATNYTITATNTGGSGATSVSITVLTAPVIAYTGSPFTYAVNSAIPVINATNTGGTIASCSASPALPAGLSISNATCQVSGTPTAVTASAAYTITATNSAGSGTATITIKVNDIVPALTYVSSPYKFSLNQTITNVIPSNTGGNPTSCSIAPALPTGLTLNTTTCVISGTPTVLYASSAFTVTATNTGGSSTAPITIAVVDVVPAIAYASPFAFVINTPITTETPSNTGGAIVSCTISPALPTGLAFSGTTCAISGTPTVLSTATTYTVTPTNTGGSSPVSIQIEVDLTAPMFVMRRVASLSTEPQVVYYSRSLTGTNNIWKVSIDGTNSTNLSQNSNSAVLPEYPSLSPDGSKVVFASQASSQSYNIWTVGTEETSSSNITALTENSAAGLDSNSPPSYSSDGTKIVFASKMNLSGQPNGASNPSYNIWIMNSDGSGRTALTQNSVSQLDSINPVFSPDGSTVYFQSETDLSGQWNGTAAKYNIWKVGSNGSAPTALTTQSTSGGFDSGEPRVSPDGTKIVFTSFMKIGTVVPASMNIWTMSNSGSDLINLTASFASGQDSKNPSFSPDGSEITFASKWDGEASFNIWLMKYDGSNAVNLTGALGAGQDSTSPSFSPDSLHIAFTSRLNIMGTPSSSNNIWVMNSNGSGQIPLTQNTSSGLDSFIGTIGVWFAP